MIFIEDERLYEKLYHSPILHAAYKNAAQNGLTDTEALVQCVLALIQQNDTLSAELLKLHQHGLHLQRRT
jgi:hypothetical protein